VKISWSALTPFWFRSKMCQTNRQTDRHTDRWTPKLYLRRSKHFAVARKNQRHSSTRFCSIPTTDTYVAAHAEDQLKKHFKHVTDDRMLHDQSERRGPSYRKWRERLTIYSTTNDWHHETERQAVKEWDRQTVRQKERQTEAKGWKWEAEKDRTDLAAII